MRRRHRPRHRHSLPSDRRSPPPALPALVPRPWPPLVRVALRHLPRREFGLRQHSGVPPRVNHRRLRTSLRPSGENRDPPICDFFPETERVLLPKKSCTVRPARLWRRALGRVSMALLTAAIARRRILRGALLFEPSLLEGQRGRRHLPGRSG